jgi:hypothetical protein
MTKMAKDVCSGDVVMSEQGERMIVEWTDPRLAGRDHAPTEDASALVGGVHCTTSAHSSVYSVWFREQP